MRQLIDAEWTTVRAAVVFLAFCGGVAVYKTEFVDSLNISRCKDAGFDHFDPDTRTCYIITYDYVWDVATMYTVGHTDLRADRVRKRLKELRYEPRVSPAMYERLRRIADRDERSRLMADYIAARREREISNSLSDGTRADGVQDGGS
jgi:hypothetical protein